MTLVKNKFNHGNEIFFVSIIALEFAPHDYKLPALGILWFSLITAAVIDCKKNTKLVRRITRRVASCSHMHVPQLLQIDCTVCGAEAT
jgi:hypothetical protein